MQIGDRLEILHGYGKDDIVLIKIGELEISDIAENKSWGFIRNAKDNIKVDAKVQRKPINKEH